MKSQSLLAVDFGSTKIACALALRRADAPDGYELLGTGLSRYPADSDGWPCEPTVLADTLERALDELGSWELPDRAIVTLSHPQLWHHVVTAQIDLASEPVPVRQRELHRLQAQAVAQALGIDREVLALEPLGYDGNGFQGVRDPRGLAATRLRGTFGLVAVPLAARRAMTRALETLGLEGERPIYGVHAVAAACPPSAASSGSRRLVIDFGGWSTDIALFEGDTMLRTHTLAWGGMSLARAIAAAMRVTPEQALALSLEGLTSSKPGVRPMIEQQLETLREHLTAIAQGDTRPDTAIVTGGSALIDGIVEWTESALQVPTSLGRSRHAQRCGELSRQLGLTAALGAIDRACVHPASLKSRAPHLLNRLVQGTKYLLTEYF